MVWFRFLTWSSRQALRTHPVQTTLTGAPEWCGLCPRSWCTGWSEKQGLIQTPQSDTRLNRAKVLFLVQYHPAWPYAALLRKKTVVGSFFPVFACDIFCWPQHAHKQRQKGCVITKHKIPQTWYQCERNIIQSDLWKLFYETQQLFFCFSCFCMFCMFRWPQHKHNKAKHAIFYVFMQTKHGIRQTIVFCANANNYDLFWNNHVLKNQSYIARSHKHMGFLTHFKKMVEKKQIGLRQPPHIHGIHYRAY